MLNVKKHAKAGFPNNKLYYASAFAPPPPQSHRFHCLRTARGQKTKVVSLSISKNCKNYILQKCALKKTVFFNALRQQNKNKMHN
jgi:hypothetical protein